MLGSRSIKHPNPLLSAIVDELEQIYERLTKDDILHGCLEGYTQNNRELINHLIWARCSKSKHSGRGHLDATVIYCMICSVYVKLSR